MSLYWARSLCTCIFILHSSPFLLWKGRIYCKNTNIFWISYQILAFSAHNHKICYIFSKLTLKRIVEHKRYTPAVELRFVRDGITTISLFFLSHKQRLVVWHLLHLSGNHETLDLPHT